MNTESFGSYLSDNRSWPSPDSSFEVRAYEWILQSCHSPLSYPIGLFPQIRSCLIFRGASTDCGVKSWERTWCAKKLWRKALSTMRWRLCISWRSARVWSVRIAAKDELCIWENRLPPTRNRGRMGRDRTLPSVSEVREQKSGDKGNLTSSCSCGWVASIIPKQPSVPAAQQNIIPTSNS